MIRRSSAIPSKIPDTVRGAGDSVESQQSGRPSEHPSESVLKVIKERQRTMEGDELSDSDTEVVFGGRQ